MQLNRILVVRTDRMGDLLMSLPAIQALRKTFPTAQISLLMRRELLPLLKNHPDVNLLLGWDLSDGDQRRGLSILKTAAWLKKGAYDAIVMFTPSKHFHVASWLAGIPVRVGYRRKWGFLLTHSIPDTKAQRRLHETEYNLELVKLLGARTDHPTLSLPPQLEADSCAQALLKQHGIREAAPPIAIHPFTSNMEKSWSLGQFKQLATQLIKQGHQLLLLGEPGKQQPLECPGALDLQGKIELGLLPAILRRSALLISNDSGPVHVAAAVGTSTLVVAPKHHARQLERWRPVGTKHKLLFSPNVDQVLQTADQMIQTQIQ